MTRVYYAHCIALYDTQQEKRDVETLEQLGWKVVNPNNESTDTLVKLSKRYGKEYMQIFFNMIDGCDLLAFRALPDGYITSGVYAEVLHARAMGLPVLELPSGVARRGLSQAQTTEYITEVGKR